MVGLTAAQIAETRQAMSRFRHPDGKPNAEQIALFLGLAPSSAKHRIKRVQAEEVVAKPRIRVPYRTATPAPERSDDRIYKVLAIGDHHDKPGRDKTRALWIGRHAAETRPDAIVSIGDWASLDSLSTHELPGSEAEAARPAFYEDLESLHESLSIFHRDLPTGSIPIVHTHGNHEHRAWRSANRNPKSNGDMPTRLDTVFHQFRWKTHAFGEFVDIFGCDFVHCPLNVMGREMGGENVERNIGNKSLRSVVFGHTHRANVLNISKVGQQRKVTILNLGTSMPMGVVEKYNGLSQTGWSYGVFELRIQAGVILSAKMYDMPELEERYG